MAIQYKQVNKKGKHPSPMCCSTDPRLLDSTFVMPRGDYSLYSQKLNYKKCFPKLSVSDILHLACGKFDFRLNLGLGDEKKLRINLILIKITLKTN